LGAQGQLRSSTLTQILIFAILAATMALFLWGRFRHDVVALAWR
jgi:hypothetical protein